MLDYIDEVSIKVFALILFTILILSFMIKFSLSIVVQMSSGLKIVKFLFFIFCKHVYSVHCFHYLVSHHMITNVIHYLQRTN